MGPITIQRIENAAIALFVMIALTSAGILWWWPLALFLVFDLSGVGYLANNRVGARLYNVVHNYTGPALLAGVYLIAASFSARVDALAVVAASWAFHVAVDRVLAYGLKDDDEPSHTHLSPVSAGPRTA